MFGRYNILQPVTERGRCSCISFSAIRVSSSGKVRRTWFTESRLHKHVSIELKIGNVSKKEEERKIFHARSSNKGSTFGLTTSLLSRLLSPKSTMYSIKYLTYCISIVTLSAIRLNNSILSLYSSQMSAIQITWETVWKEEMNNSVRAMLISNGREGLKEKEGNRIEPCTIYTNWTALLEVRNNRWARCWSSDTRAASKRLYSQRRFDCWDRGKIRSRLVVARASRYFSSDDAMSSYECNKIYKIYVKMKRACLFLRYRVSDDLP